MSLLFTFALVETAWAAEGDDDPTITEANDTWPAITEAEAEAINGGPLPETAWKPNTKDPGPYTNGPSSGEVWCYIYSTAIGLRWPAAGAAAGAYCLFMPKSANSVTYRCFDKRPNLSTGAPGIGSKNVYRKGRCRVGEWGLHPRTLKWHYQKPRPPACAPQCV